MITDSEHFKFYILPYLLEEIKNVVPPITIFLISFFYIIFEGGNQLNLFSSYRSQKIIGQMELNRISETLKEICVDFTQDLVFVIPSQI